MIELVNLTKKFGKVTAIDNMSVNIEDGTIFGLTGSNGSGKSTLLRMMSGVYKPEEGKVLIDKEEVFDNPKAKDRIIFISDYPFFFNDSTLSKMSELYKGLYSGWSNDKYDEMCRIFNFPVNQKIINMSKGMQRQAAIILAFSACPDYLFLDEIFDGLDAVIRRFLKREIVRNVSDRNMTCVISSHNLRELDDICEKMILIHDGRIVSSEDTDQLKSRIHKIQIAWNDMPSGDVFKGMDVEIISRVGNYFNIIARGDHDEVMMRLGELNPVFMEEMPATLEEAFISKMEGAGYGKEQF